MRASAGAANAPPPGAHASPPAAARRPRLRTLDKAPGPSQAPSVSYQQQLQFERKGHCVLPALLDPGDVERLRVDVEAAVAAGRLQALRHRLRVLCPGIDPATVTSEVAAQRLLENEASDELGFLQFFNLHRQRAGVARLAASPALAGAAAQLLGVRKLRLYQDCVFLKEPGYSATNWHSDLRMAPFDTNAFLTAWIPLRPIAGDEAAGDSGLMFASASHRDFALPFWHDRLDKRDLSDRGYAVEGTGPMALGDVSFHHGWMVHSAAPQPPGTQPRRALTVSFFADGARLLPREGSRLAAARHLKPGVLHSEDAESYGSWLRDLKGGARAVHEQLPLVWPPPRRRAGQPT